MYQILSEEEKNKKRQHAHERYRHLSEEEKKSQYGCERYRNSPENKKQR